MADYPVNLALRLINFGKLNLISRRLSAILFPSLSALNHGKRPIPRYDMSRQVQGAVENIIKMIRSIDSRNFDLLNVSKSEIDQNSAGIMEDIEQCRDSDLHQKKGLDEGREQF